MPRFSMLVPPMPAMMPSMTFSSKVLSSSSSSPARTGPDAITMPIPKAIAASRSARVKFRSIQPPVSVSRIALFLSKIVRKLTGLRRTPVPLASQRFEASYRPGSGRFCGGYPQEGVIQQGRHPGNNRHVGKVKHVPIVGISPDLDVEQGEIDHRAIGKAVDGVADGAADDQAERDGGEPGARPR